MALPVYDIQQSYEWNYQQAPQDAPALDVPICGGEWQLCGHRLNSPLGMPAGPLLNSRWILYYAALGFDALVYKTVRSRYRASYEPPNLLPVETKPLLGEGSVMEAASGASDTWAISFGMPSRDPAEWREDVERARRGMKPGQVLIVSVVASPEPGWSLSQVAEDFAQCAIWAEEAGAQIVEANLSCPNVCTQEADLYLSAEASGVIAGTIRSQLRHVPLALKIGLFQNREQAEGMLSAVSGYASAISTTNSITAAVRRGNTDLFGGLRRGIGGAAITARCLEELSMLRAIVERQQSKLELISVGGVMSASDVKARLKAGAVNVHLATAPMLDPLVGIRIREDLR